MGILCVVYANILYFILLHEHLLVCVQYSNVTLMELTKDLQHVGLFSLGELTVPASPNKSSN